MLSKYVGPAEARDMIPTIAPQQPPPPGPGGAPGAGAGSSLKGAVRKGGMGPRPCAIECLAACCSHAGRQYLCLRRRGRGEGGVARGGVRHRLECSKRTLGGGI